MGKSRQKRRHRLGNKWHGPQQRSSAAQDTKNPSANQSTDGTAINSSTNQPTSNDEGHRAAERNFWRRQIRVAKWLNYVTGFAAVIGLTGLVFIYLGLGETKRAGDEAKRASDIAKDSLIAANRAWIAIIGAELIAPIIVGKPMGFEIDYHNPGKSPALNVKRSGIIGHTAPPPPTGDIDEMIFPENTTCDSDTFKVHAGVVYPIATGAVPNFDHFTSEEPGHQEILSGDTVVYLMGCFKYITFDGPHKTGFCVFLPPKDGRGGKGTKLQICPTGNFAD